MEVLGYKSAEHVASGNQIQLFTLWLGPVAVILTEPKSSSSETNLPVETLWMA